jgi:hypothetical protein
MPGEKGTDPNRLDSVLYTISCGQIRLKCGGKIEEICEGWFLISEGCLLLSKRITEDAYVTDNIIPP